MGKETDPPPLFYYLIPNVVTCSFLWGQHISFSDVGLSISLSTGVIYNSKKFRSKRFVSLIRLFRVFRLSGLQYTSLTHVRLHSGQEGEGQVFRQLLPGL